MSNPVQNILHLWHAIHLIHRGVHCLLTHGATYEKDVGSLGSLASKVFGKKEESPKHGKSSYLK
jgi:hypothetical protein